ncbi:MAG TPA: type II toxin-antitoxin system RelE/ParE family toxin [Paraburkholderia sp.]|nr:type II toxin-antitoxin system RelE/ParE family toxin [Paraburkholderia sp.]
MRKWVPSGKFPKRARENAAKQIDDIVRALDVLQSSPQIGRPLGGASAMREWVISNGAHGYLALYRFIAELDVVLVVAIRSQGELRYRLTPWLRNEEGTPGSSEPHAQARTSAPRSDVS